MKKKQMAGLSNIASDRSPHLSPERILLPVDAIPENKMDEGYSSRLAAFVEFSEDAIISNTLDGTIKNWNKGSEKIFGYTADEAIGKNISLLIPPEYRDDEQTILQRVCHNESIEPYETTRVKKNGTRLYISLTASVLKDREGNRIGVLTIGRDITARRKFETDLINANQELAFQNREKEKRAAELILINEELKLTEARLKEVNNELEAFTYSVSHDLRAPLRAVNSYAQILKEDHGAALDNDGMQILQNIQYNSKKMGALIDELLSFSRLGRKEVDRIRIDMNDLLQNVVEDTNRTTSHKATIRITNMPVVYADYMLLKQVLINLLSNAIKYSSKKEAPLIEINASEENGKVVLSVKDNGAGFDMRFANKLFGVFQRLHSEKEFEGNGVGLAIVHRIITKHGGRVWAEGIEQEGATFYFTLN